MEQMGYGGYNYDNYDNYDTYDNYDNYDSYDINHIWLRHISHIYILYISHQFYEDILYLTTVPSQVFSTDGLWPNGRAVVLDSAVRDLKIHRFKNCPNRDS